MTGRIQYGRNQHNRFGVWCVVGLLVYASVSGGCLRKWRERQSARAEAARAAEVTGDAMPAGGIGPTPDAGEPSIEDAAETDAAPEVFRGVAGLLEGGEPGLEIAVWTCDDTDFRASRALAAYASRTVPLEQAVRARWRERGIRVVSVPIGLVDALASSTRAMSAVRRQRLGQLADWTPVVRGPAIAGGSMGAAGPLPAGKPRLIVRSWTEPDLSGGTLRRVMRVEMGVQIETGGLSRLLRDADRLRTVSDDGELIEGLLASFVVTGDDAIVLVGESPAIDWDALPVEGGDEDGEGSGAVRRAPSRAVGPGEPSGRSVGERMLSADAVPPRAGRPGRPPRKVLIVLIPRVEGGDGSAGPAGRGNDDSPGG